MREAITAFVARHWSVPLEAFTIRTRPVRGGLQSTVTRATITPAPHERTASRAALPQRIVVKELRGATRRESQVYAWLWDAVERPPTARLLGVDSAGDTDLVYLEDLTSGVKWPWAETAHAGAVCRELARFHDAPRQPGAMFDWDDERELRSSAAETLALAMSARDGRGVRHWRRVGALRRVVGALPVLRAAIRAGGTALIHGDVHPGNVILRRGDPGHRVTFIDWGRARNGSPLEDIASWLHSLGCWEPQARRRHDTLLRAYLGSRRSSLELDAPLRRQYWYASASNGLAGAVRYHLAVLVDPATTPRMRSNSRVALTAWERVVRRAAALLSASRGHPIAPVLRPQVGMAAPDVLDGDAFQRSAADFAKSRIRPGLCRPDGGQHVRHRPGPHEVARVERHRSVQPAATFPQAADLGETKG